MDLKRKVRDTLTMNKKGAMGLSQLPQIVIIFVVVGVVAAIGALIVSQVGDEIANTAGNESTAAQVSTDALEGQSGLTSQLPLIGLVVGLVILLGIVLGAMGGMFGGRPN